LNEKLFEIVGTPVKACFKVTGTPVKTCEIFGCRKYSESNGGTHTNGAQSMEERIRMVRSKRVTMKILAQRHFRNGV
jgi:hypothetical protein